MCILVWNAVVPFSVVIYGFTDKKVIAKTFMTCSPTQGKSAKFVSLIGLILIPKMQLNLILVFSKHWPSGPMLSLSRNVRLSVRPSVRLCVCLFTFEVPFNGLFAPTS